MERIKEVIVVEGKDDIAAVKKAIDAEMIATSGFGLNKGILQRIESAYKRCGIIILTDPDYAGERIREHLTKRFPNAKHCFLPKEEAIKGDNVGVENAKPESIIEALNKVKTLKVSSKDEFAKIDLIRHDFEGSPNASERRNQLGRYLGIGYGNAKQILSRLNRYGVSREEFEAAVVHINQAESGDIE